MKRKVNKHYLSKCILSLLFIFLCNCEKSSVGESRPNVIIVMTDDQGYGDLQVNGNPYLKTPALDKLASESVRFTNFHVNATCMPTRSALLTGRYPSRSGIWHIQSRVNMRKDEVTMADIFKANGYQTGIVGKWHLGDMYPFRPIDRGFDYALNFLGGAIGYVPDYWGNDYYDDTYLVNNNYKKFKGYSTDIWFEESLQFIEENHKKEQPFLLYIANNAPHSPYRVPEKYSRPYSNLGLDRTLSNYYGMIASIDENMQKLMDKLRELKLEENTILLFLSDNGAAGGIRVDNNEYPIGKGYNAGMRGKKGSVYEGGHRVPFFMRWPNGGIGKNRTIDDLVVHLDVLPTLMELINLQAPEAGRYDGRSFAPLIKGQVESLEDRVLFIQHQTGEFPKKDQNYVAMTKRWRYINGEELYDIWKDPGQKHNIINLEANVASNLQRSYEKWWGDVSSNYDEWCPAIIGSEKANPTLLTAHEWIFNNYPQTSNYIQDFIFEGKYQNGHWAIDIEKAGDYELLLRRLPEEALDKKAFNGVQSRIKIDNLDTIFNISDNSEMIKLKLPLQAGKTTLQTWIIDKQGKSQGAPFVQFTLLKKLESIL